MAITTSEFLSAMEGIIPLLEANKEKYNVTEILSETRYEFYAAPHSLSGFGSSLLRGAERTVKGDWGKARDNYDVPGPQVAQRLQEIRGTLKKGSLSLRNYDTTFDAKSFTLEEYKFGLKDKISFIINIIPDSKKD